MTSDRLRGAGCGAEDKVSSEEGGGGGGGDVM